MSRRAWSPDSVDDELNHAVTRYYRNHWRAPLDLDLLRSEARRVSAISAVPLAESVGQLNSAAGSACDGYPAADSRIGGAVTTLHHDQATGQARHTEDGAA